MENEEYTKVRIDNAFGMNVFNNKSRIEIFHKYKGNWIPVMKIEQVDFDPKCFLVSFYQCSDPSPYPFSSKRFLQKVINEGFKQTFNVDWRLPPVVTDILDSWTVMRSMT